MDDSCKKSLTSGLRASKTFSLVTRDSEEGANIQKLVDRTKNKSTSASKLKVSRESVKKATDNNDKSSVLEMTEHRYR